jgi:hypothetical protein
MPEDGQHDRNVQRTLTKLIKFVVAEGSTYVSFNTEYTI